MHRTLRLLTALLVLAGVFSAGVVLAQQNFGSPKTVLHVVVVKWNAEATDEQKQKALDGIKTMAGAVPGIKNIWLKADRVQPREFHTAFAIEFADRAAADAYAEHAAHEEWYKIYMPIRAESRSLQITNP